MSSDTTTTHTVERKVSSSGSEKTTTDSTQETEEGQTDDILTEALDNPGGRVLIRLAVVALAAFLAGAVVQRISLANFALKVGFLEIAEIGKEEAEEAQAKVVQGFPELRVALQRSEFRPQDRPPLYMSVEDPHIKFITIRAELEERLRSLASALGLDSTGPVTKVIDTLVAKGVFDERAGEGFSELIDMGNRAAKGARVQPDTLDWVREEGLSMLYALDALSQKAIDR